MLSFLIGCVALAICIAIGFFVLNLGFAVLIMIVAGVSTGIAKLWEYLRKPTTDYYKKQK